MALTKDTEHKITVLSDGQLEVKEITLIKEDGEVISRSNYRKVIDVGDDVSVEPQMVKDIAGGVHTPARIAARENAKTKQRQRQEANP